MEAESPLTIINRKATKHVVDETHDSIEKISKWMRDVNGIKLASKFNLRRLIAVKS